MLCAVKNFLQLYLLGTLFGRKADGSHRLMSASGLETTRPFTLSYPTHCPEVPLHEENAHFSLGILGSGYSICWGPFPKPGWVDFSLLQVQSTEIQGLFGPACMTRRGQRT